MHRDTCVFVGVVFFFFVWQLVVMCTMQRVLPATPASERHRRHHKYMQTTRLQTRKCPPAVNIRIYVDICVCVSMRLSSLSECIMR